MMSPAAQQESELQLPRVASRWHCGCKEKQASKERGGGPELDSNMGQLDLSGG